VHSSELLSFKDASANDNFYDETPSAASFPLSHLKTHTNL